VNCQTGRKIIRCSHKEFWCPMLWPPGNGPGQPKTRMPLDANNWQRQKIHKIAKSTRFSWY